MNRAVPLTDTRRVDVASLAARPRWAERAAELAIKTVAFVSIASVVLILVFVGKEALVVAAKHNRNP